ncbi:MULTISPECIES: hypothetical protein [unclassified Rhizobium]
MSNSFVNVRKEFGKDRTSRQICPLVPQGTECGPFEKPRSCRRSDFSRRKLPRMIVGWLSDEAETNSSTARWEATGPINKAEAKVA